MPMKLDYLLHLWSEGDQLVKWVTRNRPDLIPTYAKLNQPIYTPVETEQAVGQVLYMYCIVINLNLSSNSNSKTKRNQNWISNKSRSRYHTSIQYSIY